MSYVLQNLSSQTDFPTRWQIVPMADVDSKGALALAGHVYCKKE
jgi:hypothetical protein